MDTTLVNTTDLPPAVIEAEQNLALTMEEQEHVNDLMDLSKAIIVAHRLGMPIRPLIVRAVINTREG